MDPKARLDLEAPQKCSFLGLEMFPQLILCFLQHDGFHQPVQYGFPKASVGVMT